MHFALTLTIERRELFWFCDSRLNWDENTIHELLFKETRKFSICVADYRVV